MNYNAQLKAWALDRAIETVKAFGYKEMEAKYGYAGFELVEFFANKFCEYTYVAPQEEFPEAANAQAA